MSQQMGPFLPAVLGNTSMYLCLHLLMAFILFLFSKVSDPHRPTTFYHSCHPAQLPAFGEYHSPPEAQRSRLLHPHGGEVAPRLLQT